MPRILLCLVLAWSCSAQQEQRTDIVTGQVVDAASGEPIRKVNIILSNRQSGAQGVSTVTDAEGKFRLHSVQAGKYGVLAQKEGWVPAERARASQELDVKESQAPAPLNFKMKKAGVITGRVLDPDGDPIPNVNLQLKPARKTSAGSGRARNVAGWAGTDDRGEYRMRNVAPGRYRVEANSSMGQQYRAVMQRPEGGGPEQTLAPTYYPSVLEQSQGAVVQVESGQELNGIDIQLQMSQAVRVRGRVTGAPQGQFGRTMLNLMQEDDMYGGMARNVTTQGDKGTFEIAGVRPGRYTLMARSGGPDGMSYGGTLELTVPEADVDGVVLELHPPIVITGRLVLPEGAKVGQMTIMLEPKTRVGMYGSPPGRVEADGAFTIKNVMPGEYFVRTMTNMGAEPSQDLWLASVMQGSTEARDSGIRVSGATEAITVRMDTGSPVVTATVQDEKQQPAAQAAVVLIRPNESGVRPRTMCITDGTGTCKVKGLSPGEYKAFSFANFEGMDLGDPELFLEFAKQAKLIKVAKGETATLELKAIPVE